MSTLLYNPGIRIGIISLSSGYIDVTEDIESGSLTLNESASHSLTFTLSNRGGKYTSIFTPNDRIAVQMKRINWLQVFAGYLTEVPYYATFNESVSITAECTMKRIKYHWWDPGFQQTIDMMQQGLANQSSSPDAGMSQVMTDMLTNIVSWDINKIHIGSIPAEFLKQLNPIWQEVGNAVDNSLQNLGGLVVAGASGTGAGSITPPDLNGNPAPNGVLLPVTTGQAKIDSSLGQWDIAMNWPYAGPQFSASDRNAAKTYLNGPDGKGQAILVANANTGKTICLATSGDPSGYSGSSGSSAPATIAISPAAAQAIGLGSSTQIDIAWAPTGTPFGSYAPIAPKLTQLSDTGQLLQGNWYPINTTADPLSSELTGLKVLMNDTQVMPTFTSVVSSGMRKYCSAPNGDFIAWFPDYFGLYGTAAIWNLETIEMQDFTMTWTDAYLVTHEFVAGSIPAGTNAGVTQVSEGSQFISGVNELTSYGVATIELPGLFKALFNTGPGDGGLFNGVNTNMIYQQFGPRPNFDILPSIVAAGEIEFWYAVHNWMWSWAMQFSANISITFMPELWPGMLLSISEYGFQAYIHSVTHSWNLTEGGGFQTAVQIVAPSVGDGSKGGLFGLARSGANLQSGIASGGGAT